MSLLTYVGSFTSRSGTGTQAITGVGFQPKALILWTTFDGTNNSYVDFGYFSFGVDDGTTACSLGMTGDDGETNVFANNATGCYCNTGSLCYRFPDGFYGGGFNTKGLVSSLDSDGFTYNWTANGTVGSIVNFVALGGTGFSAKVGHTGASAGAQAITGVGFRPTGVILGTSNCYNVTSNFGDTDSIGGFPTVGIGWMTNTGSQGLSCNAWREISQADNSDRYQRTDKCIGYISTTHAVRSEAHYTSMDSDGFTITWDTLNDTSPFFYLAVGGTDTNCVAGSFLQSTSTGNVSTIIPGVVPQVGLFQNVCAASSSSVNNGGQSAHFIGATAGSNVRSSWVSYKNPNPSTSAKGQSTTKVIVQATVAGTGSSSTTDAAAAVTSINSNGFTFNWTTADSTQREILYFVIGANINGTGDVSFLTPDGSSTEKFTGTGAVTVGPSINIVGSMRDFSHVSQDILETVVRARSQSDLTQDILEVVTRNRVPTILTQDILEVVVLFGTVPSFESEPARWFLQRFDIKTRFEQAG